MRMPTHIAPMVLLVALAACGDGTVLVMEPVSQQDYTVEHYQEAAQTGELRTQAYGSPFADRGQDFGARILGHMKGADGVFGLNFTPNPRPPGSGPYHVVVALNATPGTDPHFVCGDRPEIETTMATDRLTMLAAFCVHDTMLSTSQGVAYGVSGPNDPAVRKLARQVTLALFPAYGHRGIGGDARTSN